MVEILQRRMFRIEAMAPPHQRDEVRRAQHVPTAKPQSQTEVTIEEGQKDWAAVKKLLQPKTLRLERTEPMFKELLSDARIRVWLPRTKHYVQHCQCVVASIPNGHRFKIGITVCPNTRYYEAHYGYAKPRTQQRDLVRYSSMVVMYTHHSRDVIAMMEHALIAHFHVHMKYRCANRKIDFDDHIRFDESASSQAEDSPGPHSLYCCHGPAM
jgi:hypothetical protein